MALLPRQLETERLDLRACVPTDLPELLTIQTSAHAMRYITGAPRTAPAVEQFLIREAGFWSTRGWGYYLARRRGDAALVAYVGLRQMDPPFAGDVEIGYVADSHWREGYAFEALTALVEAAFRHGPWHRLLATVAKPHGASQALARKLGFTPIGEAFYDGFDCDILARPK